MTSHNTPDPAAGRFAILNGMRLGGAIMVVIAMTILNKPDWNIPIWLGYILLFTGLTAFSIVPVWLARRWKSRVEIE